MTPSKKDYVGNQLHSSMCVQHSEIQMYNKSRTRQWFTIIEFSRLIIVYFQLLSMLLLKSNLIYLQRAQLLESN